MQLDQEAPAEVLASMQYFFAEKGRDAACRSPACDHFHSGEELMEDVVATP